MHSQATYCFLTKIYLYCCYAVTMPGSLTSNLMPCSVAEDGFRFFRPATLLETFNLVVLLDGLALPPTPPPLRSRYWKEEAGRGGSAAAASRPRGGRVERRRGGLKKDARRGGDLAGIRPAAAGCGAASWWRFSFGAAPRLVVNRPPVGEQRRRRRVARRRW